MGRCEQYVPLRLRPSRTACDNLGERLAHAAVEYECTICNLPQSATSPHLSPQRCLALAVQALGNASRSSLLLSLASMQLHRRRSARSFDDPPLLEFRRSMVDIMIKLSRPRRANAWLRSSELARLGKAHSYLPINCLSMTALPPCSAPSACARSAFMWVLASLIRALSHVWASGPCWYESFFLKSVHVRL
jgi:hypothetical protein